MPLLYPEKKIKRLQEIIENGNSCNPLNCDKCIFNRAGDILSHCWLYDAAAKESTHSFDIKIMQRLAKDKLTKVIFGNT